MFDREFLASTLGKASCACVAAMCLFVAISTQIEVGPADAVQAHETTGIGGIFLLVELA